MLPDEHHDSAGGGDREQVQSDGLEGQDQRAEGACQEQEREQSDQPDHEREVAVDGVDEVGALRGLASDRDRGRERLLGGADAVERRSALAREPVLGRDHRDERRPVAAPFRRSDGGLDALDTGERLGLRRRGPLRARALRRGRAARSLCRSPRGSRTRRVRRPTGPATLPGEGRAESRRRRRRGRRERQAELPAATQRWRTTVRTQAVQVRLARSSRRRRGQSSLGPTVARTTGRRVVATATLTSATSNPAMPKLRRNGTGRARRTRSAMATVVPLKTTAEPACVIAWRTATSLLTPSCRCSSRQRITTRSA